MRIKASGPEIVAVADEPGKLALPHRWILSRISGTTAEVRKALDGYDFNLIASAIYQFTWHEFCDWYVEWIKADLFSDDAAKRDQARGVLLCVLERILKLLHPICPFVTEEIWSQLPGERSTIMLEPFPEANPAWADVHPSAKLHVSLICPDAAKRELRA
jgi:valyl-tRNA synthetase